MKINRVVHNWAKTHTFQARLFIGFTRIFLSVLGVELGLYLFANGFHLSTAPWTYLLLAIMVGAVWLYPSHQLLSNEATISRFFSLKQISMGSLFMSQLFVFLLFGYSIPTYLDCKVNAPAIEKSQMPDFQSINVVFESPSSFLKGDKTVNPLSENKDNFTNKAPIKKENLFKKMLRKHFEKRLLALQKIEDKKDNHVLWGILLILAALAFAWLAAAAACGLACNGQEVLAVLVALVGLAGLVYLVILSIKKFKNKSPVKSQMGV